MSEYNPFSLKDKTILVTGASSGIGRAIAVECARLGAKVILTARNEDRLKETLSIIKEYCPETESFYFCADLTNEGEIEKLVENLDVINGVVHCAGVGNRALCKTLKKSDLDDVMNPNFFAPVLLQKQILKKKKLLKESSVVFIASRAPFAPSVGNAVYSASKGAILGYANCLALELAPQKTRVNSILPAMVWTELVAKDAELMGADYEELQKQYPLGRYGQPEDVAHLTAYLLSDASSWMTGSTIDLTGGAKEL